jgi:hypothetical protein
MFNDTVRPGDQVSFIEQMTGRTLVNMTVRCIEFSEHGQFIRVDATMGAEQRPVHEFRVNPHRQISFPDRVKGKSIGCVEFYEPQLEFGVCSVPIVIHPGEEVSIHVEHADAAVRSA